MKKILNRLFSVTLIAAFLISCGGGDSNPLIKQAQEGLKNNDYDAALASLNQAIAEDSMNTNADAYYYKGVVYAAMAENNSDVPARKNSYAEMRENFMTAMDMYESQGIVSKNAIEAELTIERKWGQEHNLGVQYATGDTAVAVVDMPLDLAEAHLQNATVINPDSVLSYEVLAEVYRMNNHMDQAVETLEKAFSLRSDNEVTDYDRLAAFYIQQKMYDKAVDLLNDALEKYPATETLAQKLADSYMNLGKNEESIEAIRLLIEKDPQNPQYRLVVGTQLFIIADGKINALSPKYDEAYELEKEVASARGAKKQEAQKKFDDISSEISSSEMQIDELIEESISELNMSIQYRSDDPSAFNVLGIVYQNRAASLFEKRNATLDNDEAGKIDTQAKELLRNAMTNYEKAAELDPNNTDYWRSLSQVYTTLGMMDKAEDAMNKAGM